MVILQMSLPIGLVEIDLLQLGGRREHNVRQLRGIVMNCSWTTVKVVPVHPLDNETGVWRSAHRVGGKDVQAHHRRVADLPGERRAKAIHVYATRLRRALRVMT